MIDFILWWISTLVCKHEKEEQGHLINAGMSKAWYCKKCGMCMETL